MAVGGMGYLTLRGCGLKELAGLHQQHDQAQLACSMVITPVNARAKPLSGR